MESGLARFERLLIALEQLSSTASLQISLGNARAADDCLERSAAILADLAPLSDELRRTGLLPPPFLARARGLLRTHEEIRTLISQNLASLQSELEESKAASSRIRRISPAYGAYKRPHPSGSTLKLESRG